MAGVSLFTTSVAKSLRYVMFLCYSMLYCLYSMLIYVMQQARWNEINSTSRLGAASETRINFPGPRPLDRWKMPLLHKLHQSNVEK